MAHPLRQQMESLWLTPLPFKGNSVSTTHPPMRPSSKVPKMSLMRFRHPPSHSQHPPFILFVITELAERFSYYGQFFPDYLFPSILRFPVEPSHFLSRSCLVADGLPPSIVCQESSTSTTIISVLGYPWVPASLLVRPSQPHLGLLPDLLVRTDGSSPHNSY